MQNIHSEIKKAETLPSEFYQDPKIWEQLKEKVFARSWLFVGDRQAIFAGQENIYPFILLDKYPGSVKHECC